MNVLKSLLSKRPAESAAGTLGTATLVTAVATHDWPLLAGSLVGYVPAVVTFVVSHGGLAGVWRLVVHGR